MAGSCTAAIFLKQFVDGLEPDASEEGKPKDPNAEVVQYAHLDIAGTMQLSNAVAG